MQIANTIVKYGGARINISCLEWTVFGPMPEKICECKSLKMMTKSGDALAPMH